MGETFRETPNPDRVSFLRSVHAGIRSNYAKDFAGQTAMQGGQVEHGRSVPLDSKEGATARTSNFQQIQDAF